MNHCEYEYEYYINIFIFIFLILFLNESAWRVISLINVFVLVPDRGNESSVPDWRYSTRLGSVPDLGILSPASSKDEILRYSDIDDGRR